MVLVQNKISPERKPGEIIVEFTLYSGPKKYNEFDTNMRDEINSQLLSIIRKCPYNASNFYDSYITGDKAKKVTITLGKYQKNNL